MFVSFGFLKSLRTAGVVAAAGVFAASAVQAAPVFTVDPTVLGAAGPNFDADFLSGTSSTLITRTGGTTASGSGYIQFNQFSLNNVAVPSGITSFVANPVGGYKLWATFSYTAALDFGTFGAVNSQYIITSLNVDVFGAQGGLGNATFNPASAAGAGTAATVTTSGTVQHIGSGTLIGGVSGLNALGGAFFNSVTTYTNTPFGDTFFVAPSPFYALAFNEFNNTTQGLLVNGNLISLNNATGAVDFIGIPEPTSIALVGLSLLALGGTRLRRKSVAQAA